jgi:hypothetical protein
MKRNKIGLCRAEEPIIDENRKGISAEERNTEQNNLD